MRLGPEVKHSSFSELIPVSILGCLWVLCLFMVGWSVQLLKAIGTDHKFRYYVCKGSSVEKTGYGRSERHGDHSNGGHPEKIFGHFDDLFARVSCCLAADASDC